MRVPRRLATAYDKIRRTAVGGYLQRAWTAVLGAARALHAIWLRSVQLRVVMVTLVVSGIVVGGCGALVIRQIVDVTLQKAVDNAKAQVRLGRDDAQEQLKSYASMEYATDAAKQVVQRAASPKRPDSQQFWVMLQGEALKPYSWPVAGPDISALITEMQPKVRGGYLAHQFVSVNPDGKGARPFLLVGSPVQTSFGYKLEMYYLFPLDAEVATVTAVNSIFGASGFALVLLLAGIAWLVTHMVVRPVRVAARTAQRLSAGLLDQRLEVRGTDELARLATSFNQMAANLQRQILRLEEMSRLQRRFTSDVSHELRTPLTTVRMAADLLFTARDEFDPAVSRSVELLQAELDRFEDLLTDLLEISRFDAGFAVLDAEPTDLVAVVDRVVERLGPLAERAGVELRISVPDPPVIVEVDPRRVERVVRNLVGNAIEHGEHGPVRIALATSETAVAVTVRDQGIGLHLGEEKLVFNRFWRADPSRARQTGGTGLGLSISLEDARLHGGWLEAWGAPGKGAQFRLTLPLRAGDRLVASPLALVPADADLGLAELGDVAALPIVSRPDPVTSRPDPVTSRPEPVTSRPESAVPGSDSDSVVSRPGSVTSRPDSVVSRPESAADPLAAPTDPLVAGAAQGGGSD